MDIFLVAEFVSLDMDDFQLGVGKQGNFQRVSESDLAQARKIRWMNDAKQRLSRRGVGDTHGNLRYAAASSTPCTLLGLTVKTGQRA